MIFNKETEYVRECDIINTNMRQNLSNADSETYKLNIATFEHGQPEEFLALMNNFKTAIGGTGNMLAEGKINYLLTLLRGESLQDFDKLASQNTGTSNSHLKFVQEGLLGCFLLIPFPRPVRCRLGNVQTQDCDV